MKQNLGKLLLVDDDKFTLQFFGDILEEHDFDYHTANSGKEAIERIGNNTYDLVITDIVLGDVNGIDVLKAAKKKIATTDVILISAHSTIDNVLESLKYGATDYLKKPVSGQELILTINRIIERKKLLSGYNSFKRYHELLQISAQISRINEFDSLVTNSLQSTTHFFDAPRAIFFQYKKRNKKKFSILGKHNISTNKAALLVEDFLDRNTIDSASKTPDIQDDLIIIPVFHQKTMYFVLIIGSTNLDTYDQTGYQAGSQLATDLHFLQEQITLTLKNIIKLESANDLALTDDVTGLKNQRYLSTCLDEDLKRSQKHKEPMAILFIDIDHFKYVNDNYGHLVGSQILRELADVMRQFVRSRDQIIRYGGDEYVITLPGLNSNAGSSIAERLRKNVEMHVFLKASHKIKITISIGVASYPETSFTKDEILTLADKALYEAKKISRNAVYNAKDLTS
jgi:diguanylate cyclase (GGDEF)-like protein